MAIMLGNLTLQQIQDRSGFQFPKEALDILQNRQEKVNRVKIADGAWHCFDIPFLIMCGSEQMARDLAMVLMPHSHEFKTPMQISWDSKEEK